MGPCLISLLPKAASFISVISDDICMLASPNSYLRPRSHSSSKLIYPIMYLTHPFGCHVVSSIDMLKIVHSSSTWPFFSLSSLCTNGDLSQRPQDHPCCFSFSHLPHPIHCCKLPSSPSNISTPLSTFQLPSPSSKVQISLFYLYQISLFYLYWWWCYPRNVLM